MASCHSWYRSILLVKEFWKSGEIFWNYFYRNYHFMSKNKNDFLLENILFKHFNDEESFIT